MLLKTETCSFYYLFEMERNNRCIKCNQELINSTLSNKALLVNLAVNYITVYVLKERYIWILSEKSKYQNKDVFRSFDETTIVYIILCIYVWRSASCEKLEEFEWKGLCLEWSGDVWGLALSSVHWRFILLISAPGATPFSETLIFHRSDTLTFGRRAR